MKTHFIKVNIYATVDKQGTKIKQRTSGIKCLSCHSNKITTDSKKPTQYDIAECEKCHYKTALCEMVKD